MTRVLSALIRGYRVVISPALQAGFGIQCRYEESCSCYMERSLQQFGLIKGLALGTKRLLSCNKWSSHG